MELLDKNKKFIQTIEPEKQISDKKEENQYEWIRKYLQERGYSIPQTLVGIGLKFFLNSLYGKFAEGASKNA